MRNPKLQRMLLVYLFISSLYGKMSKTFKKSILGHDFTQQNSAGEIYDA